MRHTFEEEFRLENPQWDFDNDILGPYTRWLEVKLLEARKQLTLYNVVATEGKCCDSFRVRSNFKEDQTCKKCGEYPWDHK